MFKNREDAGKKLAKLLKKINNKESIVLAIPRGGVLIGNEIAKRLKIPLGIIVVRKLGFPSQPEFGIGAISENNVVYLDQATIKRLDIDEKDISKIKNIEEKELIRRILLYREG
ncbi:MAG: phosphoribosyltransferase, partial [Candidatus Levybacteria bacterium]|nr:phosphoribosyltransferase [Candidatus Levybacteria bacterium]